MKGPLRKNKYQLHTNQLILSEISLDDLNDIHRLHSTPKVDEFNTLGIPKNLQETRDFIMVILKDQADQDRKHICWSIRKRPDNVFVGLAGLVLSAKRFKMAEIYFKLFPEHWGKGYATEIARRIFQFAFGDLSLHRIEAGVATGNVRSIRVLEKLGMTREGIRRKILPIRGEWKDNYHYSILIEEFNRTRIDP